MKGRRYREGTLTLTELTPEGREEIDWDAFGTLAGLHDFLDKVKRLPQVIEAPAGSLREWYVQQIQYLAGEVERFLSRVPAAERDSAERDTVEPGVAVVEPAVALDPLAVVEPAVVEPAIIEPVVVEPVVVEPVIVEPVIVEPSSTVMPSNAHSCTRCTRGRTSPR